MKTEKKITFYKCRCSICGQEIGVGFYADGVSAFRGGKMKCGFCGVNFIPVTDSERKRIEWTS